AAGAAIRYTTDGSAPTATSSLYAGPITLTQTTTLRAQAYGNGWTPSNVTVEGYQIDSAGPTISVRYTPSPNPAGWNNTQVTVTFTGTAADTRSGLASATCNHSPAVINGGTITCDVSLNPGFNAIVVHAMDNAGNGTSVGLRVTRSASRTALLITPSMRSLRV